MKFYLVPIIIIMLLTTLLFGQGQNPDETSTAGEAEKQPVVLENTPQTDDSKVIVEPPTSAPVDNNVQDNAVNEDQLFANPETVIDSTSYEKKKTDEDQDKKHVGVSGEISSINQYYMTRGFLGKGDGGDNLFNPYMDGVLYLDARLPAGIKGFGNFEAIYNARTNDPTWAIRELFIDFNIKRTLYIRTGKQVLQWGRCYLWNPTDLVNVERKTFLKKIGSREGAYGAKAQVSFGTRLNMYGFADTSGIDNVNEIGGAYKIEFLVETTEMALSVWGKKGYNPVAGYDFSTRLMGIDIAGEASLSPGSNTPHVVNSGGILRTSRDGSWTSKACIDFGRAFNFNNQPDKIQFNIEFFYNGEGYAGNVFSDDSLYAHESDIVITSTDGSKTVIPAALPVNKTVYMLGNDLYQPNYTSRYYAALFTTVNNFITSDFALKANLISNIRQGSFILSSGIDYSSINDLKASLYVNGYMGKKDTEYTFMNNAIEILLTVGIVF